MSVPIKRNPSTRETRIGTWRNIGRRGYAKDGRSHLGVLGRTARCLVNTAFSDGSRDVDASERFWSDGGFYGSVPHTPEYIFLLWCNRRIAELLEWGRNIERRMCFVVR